MSKEIARRFMQCLPEPCKAILVFSSMLLYSLQLVVKILGHWPGTQLINTKMATEAKKLPYVQSAFCTTTVGKVDRLASGVMTITDTNNVQTTIQF